MEENGITRDDLKLPTGTEDADKLAILLKVCMAHSAACQACHKWLICLPKMSLQQLNILPFLCLASLMLASHSQEEFSQGKEIIVTVLKVSLSVSVSA